MPTELDRLASALCDRYQILDLLGEGGMATVYRARDLRHNRAVAVKVLRPELAAVLGSARFLKEIEVTANLQHPHILPLFDSGEAAGFPYYVMPLIEGRRSGRSPAGAPTGDARRPVGTIRPWRGFRTSAPTRNVIAGW